MVVIEKISELLADLNSAWLDLEPGIAELRSAHNGHMDESTAKVLKKYDEFCITLLELSQVVNVVDASLTELAKAKGKTRVSPNSSVLVWIGKDE